MVKAIAFVAQTSLFELCEKLCLQWNDYQQNIKGAFSLFREDKGFNNVTLVCEDGQQLEAHKVILAASSPFFQNLPRRNKHPHPMVYMRGMKFDELSAIVDFGCSGHILFPAKVFEMLKMILLTMTYIGWLGGWKIILNIDGKDFDHAHDNHN